MNDIKGVDFLFLLGGYATPFGVAHTPTGEHLYLLEAPFQIHWEDGVKTQGELIISADLLRDDKNRNIFRGMDNIKVAEWIEKEFLRTHYKDVDRSKHWTRKITIKTVKLWQKEKK